MQPSKIVVSALGVREGFLYSLLPPEERGTDPLISAAEELALLRARSVTHARELVRWTGESFAAFNIEETEDEARYREAACLLADIGWRAHPEYRGTQSLNIIAHASFIGVDHPGRAFIALANLFRHEGIFDDSVAPEIRSLAPPRYLERARLLGAMLRVVYLFSASMPGVIPKLQWRLQPNGGAGARHSPSQCRARRRTACRPSGATCQDHRTQSRICHRGLTEPAAHLLPLWERWIGAERASTSPKVLRNQCLGCNFGSALFLPDLIRPRLRLGHLLPQGREEPAR